LAALLFIAFFAYGHAFVLPPCFCFFASLLRKPKAVKQKHDGKTKAWRQNKGRLLRSPKAF
jgi:hypothetical protein